MYQVFQSLNLTRQKTVIILACITLFLPFYITCFIHAGLLLYTFFIGDLKKAFLNVKNSHYVILFSILSFLVSLCYKNQVGVLCSVAFFIVFAMIIYCQFYGDSKLFRFILELFVFFSILCGIYGLMEYNGILDTLGIENFEVVVMDSPTVRLNSVFFNANYYAMMIEYFILMASYLLLKEVRLIKVVYYVFVIGFNLFMLYLSGCRTAWPALMIGIIVLFFMQKDRRWLLAFMVMLAIMITVLFIAPDLFPRFDNIGQYFMGRIHIWKVALENIETHILFGEGPLTYMHICSQYNNAPYTQHAHNIFIDPLLSYGLIGLIVIFPYFKTCYEQWHKLTIHSSEKNLILAFVITTLFHGLLDYTVYFIPTGFTFLLILTSASYLNKE